MEGKEKAGVGGGVQNTKEKMENRSPFSMLGFWPLPHLWGLSLRTVHSCF